MFAIYELLKLDTLQLVICYTFSCKFLILHTLQRQINVLSLNKQRSEATMERCFWSLLFLVLIMFYFVDRSREIMRRFTAKHTRWNRIKLSSVCELCADLKSGLWAASIRMYYQTWKKKITKFWKCVCIFGSILKHTKAKWIS